MKIENFPKAQELISLRDELISVLNSLENDVIEVDVKGNGTLLMRISNIAETGNGLRMSNCLHIIGIIQKKVSEEITIVENQIDAL